MTLDIFIEVPRGSQNKYEYDPRRRRLRLDRVLYSSVHFPTDYGFIERTAGGDDAGLDALVLTEQATFPGCVVRARVLGMLRMTEGGVQDDKVLCASVNDPRQDGIQSLDTVPPHTLAEIEHFFETYRRLEEREAVLEGWVGEAEAIAAIEAASAAWLRLHPTHRRRG